MYYIIYETTNHINGKYYRGMHQTQNCQEKDGFHQKNGDKNKAIHIKEKSKK